VAADMHSLDSQLIGTHGIDKKGRKAMREMEMAQKRPKALTWPWPLATKSALDFRSKAAQRPAPAL
jgi:hypothetical protein